MAIYIQTDTPQHVISRHALRSSHSNDVQSLASENKHPLIGRLQSHDRVHRPHTDQLLLSHRRYFLAGLSVAKGRENGRGLPVHVHVSHAVTHCGVREVGRTRRKLLVPFPREHVAEGVECSDVFPRRCAPIGRLPDESVDVMT